MILRKFEFGLRIRVSLLNKSATKTTLEHQTGGHAWHLEAVYLVDNSWYKNGIHVSMIESSKLLTFFKRRFYNFYANQWIMDNEVEIYNTDQNEV